MELDRDSAFGRHLLLAELVAQLERKGVISAADREAAMDRALERAGRLPHIEEEVTVACNLARASSEALNREEINPFLPRVLRRPPAFPTPPTEA
jgi:hypothetical protein